MRALDRKLIRDLRGMLGQGITISLVVAAGIAGFITLRSTYASLLESRDTYYERYRFGEAFARLERAPTSLAGRIEAIPGVALVYPRIVKPVRVVGEDLISSPVGLVISLPPDGIPPLNGIVLQEGTLPGSGRSDEALLLAAFAERRGISPGDTLRVVMNGSLRSVRIAGIAASPEFIFPVGGGGGTIPDDDRFVVFWMERSAVEPLYEMEGAFNDVVLRLQPGASERAVLSQTDLLLEPYGGTGAVGRDGQPSNFVLNGELSQLRQFAVTVPLIFLSVAAFLLHMVLTRLLQLQRTQVAALKALGYFDREIALHYFKMISGVVLAGSFLGILLGRWLGGAMTDLYAGFFGFPLLEFRTGITTPLVASGIALLAGAVGAFAALRRILALSPAEAMSPEPPARYRPTLPERLGLGRVVGPSGRMVLREIGRRPIRTLLSSIGIAMAVGILVVGRFSSDAMEFLIDHQFYRAWKEDITVTFNRPVPERAVRELLHFPGVLQSEGLRLTSARLHSGHLWRDVPIQGYRDGSGLREFIDARGASVPLPSGGIVLTGKLAEILGVSPGDTVRVTLREGRTRDATLVVSGLVDEMFGLTGHMRLADLNSLLGEEPRVSQALLRVDVSQTSDLEQRLAALPAVADVGNRNALVQRFKDQSATYLAVMTLIMTCFASVIAAGVVYNNSRVAVAERSRDLASLRVLGFTRREISTVLLGEMAVQILVAIPIGLWVGYQLCLGIAGSADPEMYRLPVILSPGTYAFAIAVVLLAAGGSALLVRRRLDRLDLIGVLKTRE